MNPFILFMIVYPNKSMDDRDAIVNILRFFLLFFFLQNSVAIAFAQQESLEFVTSRDLLHVGVDSGISLKNNKNIPATVYGVYVRQFAYVAPGGTCNQATIMYPSSNNITAGSFVMPIEIKAGKSAAVGTNYLYNMIYDAIYYLNIIIPSSPPGCALPGCTWGNDTAKYNWCIYLGALAPISNSAGYTSNVPPSTDTASSSGLYNYNLVTNYVWLGPISCNDQTLTCISSNQQTQSFS